MLYINLFLRGGKIVRVPLSEFGSTYQLYKKKLEFRRINTLNIKTQWAWDEEINHEH